MASVHVISPTAVLLGSGDSSGLTVSYNFSDVTVHKLRWSHLSPCYNRHTIIAVCGGRVGLEGRGSSGRLDRFWRSLRCNVAKIRLQPTIGRLAVPYRLLLFTPLTTNGSTIFSYSPSKYSTRSRSLANPLRR